MSIHFKPPTQHARKNKMISVLCLALIIVSLYSTCYLLFFRTTDIDITKDIEIFYRGEDGSANAVVRNKNLNYNQRIQEFMDTVTYQVEPKQGLSNGDTMTITTTYDQVLASRYHIDPINTKIKVKVKDLPIRYENATQIPQELLDKVNEDSKSYLTKNMDSILNDDFSSFYITSKPTLLQEPKRMYRVFLNSKDNEIKDKLLDIYAVSAKGEVNVSNTEVKLKSKEETIYYMITYNEINTGNKILKEDIYGEKMIVKNKQDLRKEKDFHAYMNDKYGDSYTIEIIK